MGWFVWIVESLLVLCASYSFAVAVMPDRGFLDRLVATLLYDTALILVAIHVTGFTGTLAPAPLAALATVLSLATIAISYRVAGRKQFFAAIRHDLTAPRRLVQDTWAEKEISVLTLVPALMATGICIVMVWYFRSWTWDPTWYHVPKTSYAIQNHSLYWIDTPNVFTQGNPHNVELLAVWNCIFQMDNRLDDSSQIPFLLLGAAAIAAWCRRVGASRPLAVSLGAVWVAMPPVYLQAHSTHVDIAWNAMFVCALYYTLGTPTSRDRWMSMLSWGLFLGTKYTGLFHLALWSPWVLARAVVELRDAPKGQRLKRTADITGSFLLVPALGIWKYAQNYLHKGNPMFPLMVKLRSLGINLPGPVDPSAEYGSAPDESPTFFGAPNAFQELLGSWYNDKPFYCPDVRSGGFGPVFRWLLLFCVVALALDVLRGRNWKRGVIPVLLFVESLQVPVPYMSRFVLAAGAASCICFAVLYSDIRWRPGRFVLAGLLVALTWHGYREGYRGFITYPRYLQQAMKLSPAQRNAMQVDTFLWPSEWGNAREREIKPGEAFAYDESVHFLQDLFQHDYSTKVTFVSSAVPVPVYMDRIRKLNPRWVGVSANSPHAQAIQQAGGQFLFIANDSGMAVYRMPK